MKRVWSPNRHFPYPFNFRQHTLCNWRFFISWSFLEYLFKCFSLRSPLFHHKHNWVHREVKHNLSLKKALNHWIVYWDTPTDIWSHHPWPTPFKNSYQFSQSPFLSAMLLYEVIMTVVQQCCQLDYIIRLAAYFLLSISWSRSSEDSEGWVKRCFFKKKILTCLFNLALIC